jgi:hypothetical protein
MRIGAFEGLVALCTAALDHTYTVSQTMRMHCHAVTQSPPTVQPQN